MYSGLKIKYFHFFQFRYYLNQLWNLENKISYFSIYQFFGQNMLYLKFYQFYTVLHSFTQFYQYFIIGLFT
jgi:hypothetical protein